MSPSTEQRENRELASELKFLVTPEIGEQVREWSRRYLVADPHGSGTLQDEYLITSLYFDTENFDVYHRNGSFGRSKYRIRRYGACNEVFLERKLKTRGLVSKRRSIVTTNLLANLSSDEPAKGWPGAWYHRRLLARKLRPVCQISYERTARVSMTNLGVIRLTVDQNVLAQRTSGFAFNTDDAAAPIIPDRMIIEMKFRSELPTIFKRLVEEFALTAQPFSKYRFSAGQLRLIPSLPAAEAPSTTAPACLTTS